MQQSHDCKLNVEGNDAVKIFFNVLNFNQLPQYTSIQNISIGNLNLDSFDNQSNNIFSLKNCQVSSINFSNFNNHGKITFINISPIDSNFFSSPKFGFFSRGNGNNSSPLDSIYGNTASYEKNLNISHSNLGNLDFVSCQWNKYHVYVNSSKLLNIFYTNTVFPKSIEITKYNNISKQEELAKLKDVYEQLQTVASKQGDKTNSIFWQAKAQECYRQILSYKALDWWMLQSNRISNNYRQNWSRGIFFTLSSALIFYIPLVLCSDGDFNICFNWNDCNTLERLSYFVDKHLSNFFEFLNPTHKADFLKVETPDSFRFLSGFFDFFGRIFVGFGIYQTIQAFRKLGKGGD